MSEKLPLAVDLDGTLILDDASYATFFRFALRAPWRLPLSVLWYRAGGLAGLKAKIRPYAPAAQSFRYDERVLAWLREERAAGRRIVLASASDEVVVNAVATHVGLFDGVYASDGVINLKRDKKAARLAEVFPEGFVYAGNSEDDWAVWEAAKRAVVVNARAELQRRAQAAFDVERCFERQR